MKTATVVMSVTGLLLSTVGLAAVGHSEKVGSLLEGLSFIIFGIALIVYATFWLIMVRVGEDDS